MKFDDIKLWSELYCLSDEANISKPFRIYAFVEKTKYNKNLDFQRTNFDANVGEDILIYKKFQLNTDIIPITIYCIRSDFGERRPLDRIEHGDLEKLTPINSKLFNTFKHALIELVFRDLTAFN